MSFLTQVAQNFGASPPAAAIANNASKEDAFANLRNAIRRQHPELPQDTPMKKGGKVSTASSRADGVAQRGKTKGRMC
jgi:hypothetical protein